MSSAKLLDYFLRSNESNINQSPLHHLSYGRLNVPIEGPDGSSVIMMHPSPYLIDVAFVTSQKIV